MIRIFVTDRGIGHSSKLIAFVILSFWVSLEIPSLASTCAFFEIQAYNLKQSTMNTLCAAYTLDRVVGTSKFQITKPDALFVVFLGIKWAYDF